MDQQLGALASGMVHYRDKTIVIVRLARQLVIGKSKEVLLHCDAVQRTCSGRDRYSHNVGFSIRKSHACVVSTDACRLTLCPRVVHYTVSSRLKTCSCM